MTNVSGGRESIQTHTDQQREREEEVWQEMEAIKAKYESEIKEIQDKLEEEMAKGKVFLLVEREFRQKRENTATTDTEQMQDQCECVSGMTDLDREMPETGRESDKDRKKHAKKMEGVWIIKNRQKARGKDWKDRRM